MISLFFIITQQIFDLYYRILLFLMQISHSIPLIKFIFQYEVVSFCQVCLYHYIFLFCVVFYSPQSPFFKQNAAKTIVIFCVLLIIFAKKTEFCLSLIKITFLFGHFYKLIKFSRKDIIVRRIVLSIRLIIVQETYANYMDQSIKRHQDTITFNCFAKVCLQFLK